MKVAVQRDQAVWERERFEVDIPDGTPADELPQALRDAIESFKGYGGAGYSTEVLSQSVDGVDEQIVGRLFNGVEIKL